MAVEVRFAPEAAADVAAGFRWYDEQRSGLGSRRFPYAVFYEFSGGTVTVYCIVHTAREPSKWQSRLP